MSTFAPKTPKKQPAAKAPAQPQAKDLQINETKDWLTIQKDWAKLQVEKLQAHAEKFFFVDDEDLPLSKHMLFVSILGFFAAFFLWASFATLDQVTKGEGRIIPIGDIQVVQNLEGGIVEEFLVREGDNVERGQILMRLRNVGAASDLGSNQARYLGLLATVTRLQAEADGSDTITFPESVIKGASQSVTEELNSFKANRERRRGQTAVLDQQLAQRRQEVSELRSRSSDLASVIGLSQKEKAMIEPLVERGSAPAIELIQLERGIREKQTELNGVRQSLPRAEAAVQEAQARLNEVLTTARAEAQIELSGKLAEMNSIKATLGALEDRKDRTEITSPVNGTIQDFKVNTVGGVVRPGDPIVEIVPMDDNLLVEANIRPSDIAFLYPGQPAMVKITAYDFSIYGGLKGEVVNISADTITNEKGESFYRVRVRTDENTLVRKGQILPIIPGMVAQVDILTGKKTVMEYLLKPFVKTLGNAMKER